MGDAKRACDLVGRDTIGHQGRDPAVLRDFGVDRAEVYEPAKRIIAYVAEVDAVRHRSSVACGRLRAARESHPINSMIPTRPRPRAAAGDELLLQESSSRALTPTDRTAVRVNPTEVSFRFYAQLNDFLRVPYRGRRFMHAVAARSSVKDAFESLGVPHPEVDLVLVNRAAEGFSYRLQHGDDVSVYPAFRTIDISEIRRTAPDVSGAIRFAVDVHLNKLASLLRLCGFDALVYHDDEDIADAAAREARVVLTRDVALLKRAAVQRGRWVRHTDPEEQLVEVLESFALVDQMNPFSRCLRCNTPIVSVAAATVVAHVPSRIRAAFREFWRCPGCDRIFWRGSHYEQLSSLIERVRRRG